MLNRRRAARGGKSRAVGHGAVLWRTAALSEGAHLSAAAFGPGGREAEGAGKFGSYVGAFSNSSEETTAVRRRGTKRSYLSRP